MADPKWTPGPWKAGVGAITANNRTILLANAPGFNSGEQMVATVRLAAAAPDLYEACEEALNVLEVRGTKLAAERMALRMLERALRKARGEEVRDKREMSKSWTPGPWEASKHVVKKRGVRVRRSKRDSGHAVEDAHLIAAAPDLYEALECLLGVEKCDACIERVCAGDEDCPCDGKCHAEVGAARRKARRALRKARGEHAEVSG